MFRLFLLTIILFGCLPRGGKRLSKTSYSGSQEVVLVEDSRYEVSTSKEVLEIYYKGKRNWSWNGWERDSLFKLVLAQSDEKIHVIKNQSRKIQDQAKYLAAEFIDLGKVSIYNKSKGTLEGMVIVEEYKSPLGYWGRKFVINGKIIFEVVDGIE
jgi:hypothetical protein